MNLRINFFHFVKFFSSLGNLKQPNVISGFLRSPMILLAVIGCSLGISFSWYVAFIHVAQLNELAPLHYNIYFGIDFFGPRNWLMMYPTIATIIVVVNIIIASLVFQLSRLLSHILVGVAFFAVVLIDIALYFVTLITS